jgi:DNA topoisomerase-3
MKLVIAEKPSLARSVADVIGIVKTHKDKGYIECKDGYCVTWVFGHIIEQVKPEVYNAKWKLFNWDNHTIYPDEWKYQTKPDAIAQFNNIKALVDKAEVIINCGDPDREGQLLIDELLVLWGVTKPIKRLLILDPKPAAIKKALDNIEDNKKYYSWYQAGLLRTQADWLIGFNATPAFTMLGNKIGIQGVVSSGRVQTPTLKLIYDREMAIKNYKPLSFYNLIATFTTKENKQFTAKLDLKHLVESTASNLSVTTNPVLANIKLDVEGRLTDQNALKHIQAAVLANNGTITKYEVKDGETAQPLPFKLSDLQAVINAKLGLSADDVLKIAQSLYEKQLTTYPRTACDYLPESLHSDGASLLAKLANLYPEAKKADANIKSRAFNDKKLGGESHFAIIPTGEINSLSTLSDNERKTYDIIVKQYIAQFYPPIKFEQTTGVVNCATFNFNFRGKVVKDSGWKALFINDVITEDDEDRATDEDSQTLPPLSLNQSVTHLSDEVKKSTTTKPKSYTEGTLIKAMANIHSELDNIISSYYPDKETANKVSARFKTVLKETAGLGTEATRAGIIKTLHTREYIITAKKKLSITEKGIAFIEMLTTKDNLHEFSIVTSPITTAMYEQQLDDVLNNKLTPEAFIKSLKDNINKLIEVAKSAFDNATPAKPAAIPTGKKCPECQSDMVMKKGKFGEFESCSNYPACKYIAKKEKLEFAPTAAGNPDYGVKCTGEICPECKSAIVEKDGKFGRFKTCSNYPKCKWSPPKKDKSKPIVKQ